jgi:AcrR family transcriptional regulator
MAVLDEQLAAARTADDFLELLRRTLVELMREDPDFMTLLFELFTLSRHNDELAGEFSELLRRTREHVAALLSAKEADGVLRLRADPEAVADLLFALADGIGLRMLAEPDRDYSATIQAGVRAVRAVID